MKDVSPIKDLDDVGIIYRRLQKYEKHREAELVMLGCNVALRISDLLNLRFDDIEESDVDDQLIGYVELGEKKTRKSKKLTINSRGMKSVHRLRELHPEAVYLFQSSGNRTKGMNKPVSRQYISKLLIEVRESLSLSYRLNTHSFRKTFGYHAYKNGTDIHVLQKLFNHSSSRETLLYIGIGDEDIRDVYLNINIGL